MSPTPTLAKSPRVPSLMRNLSFALMWSSVAASGFGDRMIQLVSWTLLGIDQPNAQASSIQAGVYFFFFLPYLLFGPVGGWLADTLPRKWIMFACDQGRGFILLWAMLLLPASVHSVVALDQQWKVYGLVALVGMFAGIFSPTKNAAIPQIVRREKLQSANAIILGIALIASMIGLGVGSRIIEQVNLKAGLQLGMLLFMVSGCFFIFLKTIPKKHSAPINQPKQSQIKRLTSGLAYIKNHRPIATLIGVNMLFWAAANIFLAATAALCKNSYGIAPELLKSHIGDLGIALGAGMLLSSLLVAWLSITRESSWIAMLSLAASGVCMFALYFTQTYYIAVALTALTGLFGNIAMIIITTLIQTLTPNYIRGRLFGARDVLTTSSSIIVNGLIWQMPNADQWMPLALIITSGVLFVWGLWAAIDQLTHGPMPCAGTNFLWRGLRVFCMTWHRVTWVGRSNIPSSGPVILAANHTTGMDPNLMQTGSLRMVRWLMLTSYEFKALNFLWKRIHPICLDLEADNLNEIRKVINILKNEDAVVGLFPEGALQRDHRNLQAFQPGIAMIAKRSKATIVPTWISGTVKSKSLLWHFAWPSKSHIIFGKPYIPDPKLKATEVAAQLRQKLIDLSHLAPPD